MRHTTTDIRRVTCDAQRTTRHILHSTFYISSTFAVLCSLFVVFAPATYALNIATDPGLKVLSVTTIPEFVELLIEGAVAIVLPITGIMVVYSGFLFVTARGSEEKLRKAKSGLFWSLVGAAVVVAAYILASAFAEFVQSL